MSSSAARTSISEARNILSVFSPDWLNKPVTRDLDRRRFLVLFVKEKLNSYQQDLLSRSEMIYDCPDFSLLSLSYENAFPGKKSLREKLVQLKPCFQPWDKESAGLMGLPVPACLDSEVICEHFDDRKNIHSFLGTGSVKGNVNNFSIAVDNLPHHLVPGREYVASMWYFYSKEKVNQNYLIVQERFSNGTVKWQGMCSATFPLAFYGNWLYLETSFKVDSANSSLSVFFNGKKESKDIFYADELLIRPVNENVISSFSQNGNTYLFMNTIPFDTLSATR